MSNEPNPRSPSDDVSDDLQLVQETMAALGITPESIMEAIERNEAGCSAQAEFLPLSDAEWKVVKTALPPDSPQANTMDNRTFVNTVLEAAHRGGRWIDFRKNTPYPEAVRRRFGRWAHLDTWQRLASEIRNGELSSERKSQIEAAAAWAERLRKKSVS
ncbi:transposase [Hyphomicrobium sp.]|uniref:transposase n=1 Tax=Hyphomicrobium sp. TaxID=82 RepID=UPI000FA4C522|nr:transposase [Hyphomicrobium sp.]RUO97676.1 MAG: transposase [Hyphomicrobium sp.]